MGDSAMSSKRSFADVDSEDHDESFPSTARRGNGYHPKRQKQYGTGNHKAKQDRSSFAKKRIRNIERLLQRNKDLPADVQNDLQRELATLKATVADQSLQKKRSAMISKYHMVRFFERKKASRLVKQLRRKMEENPDSSGLEDVKRQLHIAEVDEAYTIHHPHMEPYRSLYGGVVKADSKENQDGDEAEEEAKKQVPAAKVALGSERPPMWSVVEEAMEQGTEALQQLRERRPDDSSTSTAKTPTPRAARKARHGRPDDGRRGPTVGGDDARDKSAGKKADRAAPGHGGQAGEKTKLNRRERRRLMREAEAEKNSDEEEEAGGFFEGL